MLKGWILLSVLPLIFGAAYVGKEMTPRQRIVLAVATIAVVIYIVFELHDLGLV